MQTAAGTCLVVSLPPERLGIAAGSEDNVPELEYRSEVGGLVHAARVVVVVVYGRDENVAQDSCSDRVGK